MTKISFICTTYNDSEDVHKLLESLTHQTKKPDEVIIVDSKSSDNTVATIKEFQSVLPIKIIIQKCTRGRGRNLAIEQSRGEVIAVSDAGCIAYPDWLEKITKPILTKKADVVAGTYSMPTPSKVSYYSAPYLGTMSHNFNKRNFLPSTRSSAYSKKAWAKVGGYPEAYKYAAEDLVFAQKLKLEKKLKWFVEAKPLVEWTPATTWAKFFHDMSNHTKGNLESGYMRHLKKNYLVALRYAIGLPLILAALISLNSMLLAFSFMLLAIYFLYPASKFRYLVRNPFDIIIFGWTQILADLAILHGLFTPI